MGLLVTALTKENYFRKKSTAQLKINARTNFTFPTIVQCRLCFYTYTHNDARIFLKSHLYFVDLIINFLNLNMQWMSFGSGISWSYTRHRQGFWPRINCSQMKLPDFESPSGDSLSKSANFGLSMWIFYVKNHPNLSNFFFHWRILI